MPEAGNPRLSLFRIGDANTSHYQFPCRTVLSGEEALLKAILEDAIGTWRRYEHVLGGEACIIRDELRAWFAGASAPFSFQDCCDVFHLDAAAVRKRLLAPR